MTTTRTRRNRAVTGAVTSLAALLMLTGCQSSSSSGDGGLGSSDTSTSSSSSGASASKSTKSKSASASPSASPSATGTQVVQIGGPDVPDTEDASVKAAYETVQQLNRLENSAGDPPAPPAEEELKKFLGGEALKNELEVYAGMVAAHEQGKPVESGNIRVGWLGTDNAGEIFGEGFRYQHGSIQMRVCEDWSALKNPDGSAAVPVEKSKRTMRASVERRADGHFYLISYRVEHYGCN